MPNCTQAMNSAKIKKDARQHLGSRACIFILFSNYYECARNSQRLVSLWTITVSINVTGITLTGKSSLPLCQQRFFPGWRIAEVLNEEIHELANPGR